MSAYADLLDRLLSLAPRDGYLDVHDIPDLTDADIAAVLEEADGLLVDAVASLTFDVVLASQLKSRNATHARYALIGAALVHDLESGARAYLLRDLKAEAERHHWEGVDRGRERAKEGEL